MAVLAICEIPSRKKTFTALKRRRFTTQTSHPDVTNTEVLPSHQFSCPEYGTLTNTNDHWPIQYAVIFSTFSYKSYDLITCLCLLAGKYYFRETESSRGRVKGKGMSKGTLRNIHLAVQKIKQRILKNYGNLTSDSTKIQLTNTAINVQNMLFSTIRCPLALLRFVA